MGGDQGDGLSLAIRIIMVLMVLGAIALFALAGRALARRAPPPRRRLATALMALLGAGFGGLLVIWTFYGSVWSPPPRLSLAIPPGFDAPVVILLEDPRAGQALEWQGGALPFTAEAAGIAVPPSGIVRVRSLGPMAVGNSVEAIWPDGRRGMVGGGNFGPPGTGATAFLMIEPPDAPSSGARPQPYDEPAVGAYIAERERRR